MRPTHMFFGALRRYETETQFNTAFNISETADYEYVDKINTISWMKKNTNIEGLLDEEFDSYKIGKILRTLPEHEAGQNRALLFTENVYENLYTKAAMNGCDC